MLDESEAALDESAAELEKPDAPQAYLGGNPSTQGGVVWSPSLIGGEPSEQQDPLLLLVEAVSIVPAVPAVSSLVRASGLQQVKSRPLSQRIGGLPWWHSFRTNDLDTAPCGLYPQSRLPAY